MRTEFIVGCYDRMNRRKACVLKEDGVFGRDSVSRWVRRAPRNPDPVKQWLTFLRNHREAIAAMDLFTVPTLTFGVLRWQPRLKSHSSEDQTFLLETRTRRGSHFLRASFAGRRISLPSKPKYLRQVERNPLMPAQRFGERQPRGCVFFEKTLDKGTVNLVISEYIEITEMLVCTKITYNPDPGGPEIHFPL